MIKYLKKDITTVTKGLVVHGCNCSGGFGSGVAGDIKDVWPEVEELFRLTKDPELGQMFVKDINEDLCVGNMYTQVGYGYDGGRYANLEAIKYGLRSAIDFCKQYNISNLYMPKIGCGLGGLNWLNDVYPMIMELDHKGVEINICIK